MLKYLRSIFKRVDANKDHQAVLDALDQSLQNIKVASEELKKELSILTASGLWLDKWGEWFGLSRKPSETDDGFRERILDVLRQDRLTIPAIIELIKKVLGDDTAIDIYEPYKNIFRWNISAYSGEDKYQDNEYYRTGVIDIKINKPVTEELLALINLIRAAGTRILVTYEP